MKYNFDQLSDRRNSNSIKWDVKDNELPMWIADMDFMVFPKIQEALIEAVNKGAYGYSYPTKEFFLAYQEWWQKRHHLLIDTQEMVFVSGVVSALDSLVRLLTNVNDAVMILSPSYNCFFSVIKNNNRSLVTSDIIYQNDDFVIDYQDVEKKIIEENVRLFIFCNPHNPTGKVWSKEEIEKIVRICDKHQVYFISDEIHCDIVDPGYEYVPALSVYEKAITCLSPSKVFNLAGLHSAVVVIKDEELRNKAQEAFYHDDVGEPNYFMESATKAAYLYGDDFVDQLNAYLYQNKRYVSEYINENIPKLKVVSKNGTYLMWIDIYAYNIPSERFVKELREETGLFLAEGIHYGDNADGYIRMNVATSLANVKDAMNRLQKYLKDKE